MDVILAKLNSSQLQSEVPRSGHARGLHNRGIFAGAFLICIPALFGGQCRLASLGRSSPSFTFTRVMGSRRTNNSQGAALFGSSTSVVRSVLRSPP